MNVFEQNRAAMYLDFLPTYSSSLQNELKITQLQ